VSRSPRTVDPRIKVRGYAHAERLPASMFVLCGSEAGLHLHPETRRHTSNEIVLLLSGTIGGLGRPSMSYATPNYAALISVTPTRLF
jgi:hypothetical protein